MHSKPNIANYIKEKLKSTQFYKTTVNGSTIVACFGEDVYGELVKFMQTKHRADVAVVINSTSKKVKLTKSTTTSFNFSKFAQVLGLKQTGDIAVGELNEKVIQFTKKLIICS